MGSNLLSYGFRPLSGYLISKYASCGYSIDNYYGKKFPSPLGVSYFQMMQI